MLRRFAFLVHFPLPRPAPLYRYYILFPSAKTNTTTATCALVLSYPQVAAARVLHGLLASAARASRRRALLRWRQAAAGAAASDRLRGAKHAALQRCLRARSSRDLAVAWGVLRTRARESRALVSGAVRLEGILFRARKRALSRRLGAWRSASLAEAIAEGGRQAARGRRVAAVRVLASVSARVRRRKLEGGWRALVLLVADGRRVESEQASRSERAGVLARRCADRARSRALAGAWGAWTRAVAQRRLRGAVCTATSLLEGERASLARQLQLLKLTGAVRLMVSVTERSNRCAVDWVQSFFLVERDLGQEKGLCVYYVFFRSSGGGEHSFRLMLGKGACFRVSY